MPRANGERANVLSRDPACAIHVVQRLEANSLRVVAEYTHIYPRKLQGILPPFHPVTLPAPAPPPHPPYLPRPVHSIHSILRLGGSITLCLKHSLMLTAAGENFGLAAGVLGVATAIPLIYGWFSRRSPSARMHVLERLLLETEGLFRSALEDGLLGDHHSLERLHSRIWAYVFSIPLCTRIMR